MKAYKLKQDFADISIPKEFDNKISKDSCVEFRDGFYVHRFKNLPFGFPFYCFSKDEVENNTDLFEPINNYEPFIDVVKRAMI
jgi:hypothetical protein